MFKSNTTRRNLYILFSLITRPQNRGRGGAFIRGGGAYFKFWSMGGAFIRRGSLFEGGGALIRGFTVILGEGTKPPTV